MKARSRPWKLVPPLLMVVIVAVALVADFWTLLASGLLTPTTEPSSTMPTHTSTASRSLTATDTPTSMSLPSNASTLTITSTSSPANTPTAANSPTPTKAPTSTHPISTPINTATSTPIDTPTLTNTPTPTKMQTFTRTPTPTKISIPTDTPTLTPTDTPSITPKSTPFPTDALPPLDPSLVWVSPDEGALLPFGQDVKLEWEGDLGDNEFFEARVRLEGKQGFDKMGWTKAQYQFISASKLAQTGTYEWQVVIVSLSHGDKARSQIWWFEVR